MLHVLRQQPNGVFSDCLGDRNELDDIDPPLAFHLGDEGLRLSSENDGA